LSADAIVTAASEGERFDRGDRVVTIVADLPQLSVVELEFGPSFEVPPHSHDDHVDAFYVLEGEVEFTLADGTVRGGPGTFVAAPPGALHGFRTPGPRRARVLNLHAPDAGFAESIRQQ
jgi:quercetin dioxygenase-like cupin family protein